MNISNGGETSSSSVTPFDLETFLNILDNVHDKTSTNPTKTDDTSTNTPNFDGSFSYEMAKDLDAKITNLNTIIDESVGKIDEDISYLKNRSIPENDYFKTANKLNSIALYEIILSPICIILATFVIYVLFTNDKNVIDALPIIIGLIGIGAIYQVAKAYSQINTISNKYEKMIERVDKIENNIKDQS